MSIYYDNENRQSYRQRQQARREEDAKRREESKAPPVEPTLDPSYFNPDCSRLSYSQRAALRKAANDGRKESEKLAAKRAAEREASIPEHERRRANHWRQTYERRKALDRSGNRQSPQILRDLKKKADLEDEVIEKEYQEKQRQHRIETDPAIREAIAYAEKHFASCAVEDKPKWAEVVAIASEGDKSLAWTRARELTEVALQKQRQLQAEHDAKTLAGLSGREALRIQADRLEEDLASIPTEEIT